MSRRTIMIVGVVLAVIAAVDLICTKASRGPAVGISIGDTVWDDFTETVEPDGTVKKTAMSGDEQLTLYVPAGAKGKEKRYEVRKNGELTRIGRLDEFGKEVYFGIYHMKGYLWVTGDNSDPNQSVSENLNPDGSVSNRYIDRKDGSREGFFFDSGKKTSHRYRKDGVATIDYFDKNEKLSCRREFDDPVGFSDVTYRADGTRKYRQVWRVMREKWSESCRLERIEELNRDGDVARVIILNSNSGPQEVRTTLPDGNVRVVYYRQNGTAVAAEIESKEGEVIRADAPNAETDTVVLSEEMLHNCDEFTRSPAGI